MNEVAGALAIVRDYRVSAAFDSARRAPRPAYASDGPRAMLKQRDIKSDIRNMPTHEEEPWERDRQRLGDARANAIWEKRRSQLGVARQRRGRSAYTPGARSATRRM